MMRFLRRCIRLRKDEEGSTLIEFAFVAPVFIVMVIGVFDISHTLYASSILQGTMQKAGRDFTLENSGSNKDALQNWVTSQVQNIAPSATVTFSQKAYFDFEDVGQPEAYSDDNGDGVCNDNEPFEDANDNGQWDADRGQAGLGGARDAVLFTATASYDRLFPMAGLIGLSDTVTLSGSTVLRNQPYDTQDRSVTTRNCPA